MEKRNKQLKKEQSHFAHISYNQIFSVRNFWTLPFFFFERVVKRVLLAYPICFLF